MVVCAVLAVAAAQYAQPYSGPAYSVQPDVRTYWTNLAAPYTRYAAALYNGFAANSAGRYVDLNGVKQTVDYVVDESGYRVSGTNLPAAAVTDVKTLAKTKSGCRKKRSALLISDTPNVAAAKAEHARLYNEAALRVYPQTRSPLDL
ncbi:uncharacterized protein LOC119100306 [Pollicipes pollicipes]|uniref:uncharacterized protein LOC119100306 n=1 Tax=Pollicipes pollicipes TaxID=41117 RepID=UPI001884C8C1|nr:uncharacterized protein LOC119100306 [Pollicipes pollicipes]